MSTEKVKEVVINSLKPEAAPEQAFQVIGEILVGFDGFESVTRSQDISDPLTFMDEVTWRDSEAALSAQSAIEKHPQFPEFAGLFQETKFFSHFKSLN